MLDFFLWSQWYPRRQMIDDHSARLLVSTKTYFQRTREFLIYSPTRQDLVFETAFEHWSSCYWPYQLTTNLLNLFNSYFAQHHSVKSGLAMIPVRATPRGLRAKVFPRLITDNSRNDRTSCSVNIAIVFSSAVTIRGYDFDWPMLLRHKSFVTFSMSCIPDFTVLHVNSADWASRPWVNAWFLVLIMLML